MSKIEEAKELLTELGMPPQQQSEMCCLVLLALADIREGDSWSEATNKWIRIHDIIQFAADGYSKEYAENSRETIRKQALHHYRNAALIEDNRCATNSPNYRYRLTKESLALIRKKDSMEFHEVMADYKVGHVSLIEQYASRRQMQKMPVNINGQFLSFSTGKHNQLQKAILEEFAPRFVPEAQCLYVGDTTNKDLVLDREGLKRLGFVISQHDKMPDVVLYSPSKNWLFFVEAVTSVGPMSPKRLIELYDMTRNVTAGVVYVTAFPDKKTFKKFVEELAWETEVWLSDVPDHMIHLNGDKFLGPRA